MRHAIVLGCLVATAGAARADGIAWIAPDGCPGGEAVTAAVVANLGRPLAPGEVDAKLTVTKQGRRWRVKMFVHTPTGGGERDLEAGSCRDLADSAALILALAIDSMAGLPVPDPPPAEEVTQPEPTFADSETPPMPDLTRRHIDTSDDEPEALPIAVRVRALVGGDLGSLPGAASGWGAGATLALGTWSIDAAVSRFSEQRAMVPGSSTKGALMGLTDVDARGCYIGGRRWRAGVCLGADLAFTHSQGFGFTDPIDRTSTGGGVQVAATWAVPLVGPIAARADVDATVQLVRRDLVDGSSGTVIHDPDILVWRGFAGLEASWR